MVLKMVNYMEELFLSWRVGIILIASKIRTRETADMNRWTKGTWSLNQRTDLTKRFPIITNVVAESINQSTKTPSSLLFFMQDNNLCIICCSAEIILEWELKMCKNVVEYLNLFEKKTFFIPGNRRLFPRQSRLIRAILIKVRVSVSLHITRVFLMFYYEHFPMHALLYAEGYTMENNNPKKTTIRCTYNEGDRGKEEQNWREKNIIMLLFSIIK